MVEYKKVKWIENDPYNGNIEKWVYAEYNHTANITSYYDHRFIYILSIQQVDNDNILKAINILEDNFDECEDLTNEEYRLLRISNFRWQLTFGLEELKIIEDVMNYNNQIYTHFDEKARVIYDKIFDFVIEANKVLDKLNEANK
jgi:hypothetical protein